MNVGTIDRKIRILAGLAVLVLAFFFFNGVATSAAWIMLVGGFVLLTTGIMNFCPAYKLLGISTRKSRT